MVLLGTEHRTATIQYIYTHTHVVAAVFSVEAYMCFLNILLHCFMLHVTNCSHCVTVLFDGVGVINREKSVDITTLQMSVVEFL